MAKTFYYGKSKLDITEDLEAYNNFRNTFVPFADEAARKFEEQYKSENHGLGGLVKNFDKQVMNAITPVLMNCSKLLFENGIYDVNKDIFLDQYCTRYISVVDSFQKFVDKYYEIKNDNEATKMYRNERKASRGMIVGGGFGLSGAAKGMVTAGALNMASGFMHSIANGIGNMFSDSACRKKMDAIFYDHNTLEELKDAVWESAFNMHYAYLDVLEERTGKRINKFEKDAYQKAEAICKNIVNLQPDYESVQPAICQMLLAHPYEFDFYCVIIAQYGDENNYLQKIGEFFHVDIDAIKVYIYGTIIKKIDFKLKNDMEWVISNAESYGVHFGVKKNVIEETSNRIRNSYNEYLLSNSYYEKRKVYLLGDSKRIQLDETMDSCLQECKICANNLYDTYLMGREGSFVPKLVKEDPKLSKHRKFLFMISEDKLNQSFKFKISYNLIEYGRGKCIRVSDVHKIKVENSKITINDVYNYQCSRLQEDKKLEEFLSKLTRNIQTTYRNTLTTVLELNDLFNEFGKNTLHNVTAYLTNNSKAIANLYCDYNIFCEDDIDKMIAVNNIVKKLEYYGVERKHLNPILWFNLSHVEKLSEDSVIATEEFNEEKYRVDGDDYVLLTLKYLYFTNSNRKIELNKLTGFSINGRNIELNVDHKKVQIAVCKYSDAKVLIELFVNIIKIINGGKAGNMTYDSNDETMRDKLEGCNNKINQMLLRKSKEEERDKFLKFLAINYENEYFDSEMAKYSDKYSISVKPKEVLFFIKNTEPKSEEAIFFTKDKVILLWKDSEGTIKVDGSRKFKDITCFKLESGETNAPGTYGKKTAVNMYSNNNTHVNCYETDFSIEYKRKNVCEDIANEVLWTLQEAMGIAANRVSFNIFDFLLKELKRCELYSNENNKLMFLKYDADNFDEKLAMANNNFARLSNNEEAIFVFDDTMLHSVASGFVLTNKHLYHKELPNNKVALTDVEEIQFNSGFLKAIVIITTTGQRYELSYNTTISSKNGLMDFLTTAIFYMKDNPESVLTGKDEKEKEIADYAKAEKQFKAFRNQKGVYLEVEKNIVTATKRKCDELALPSGNQSALIFKGFTSNFDVIFDKMSRSGYYYKVDNIEVPLMLFFKDSDFSGGFIITSEAVYTSAGVIAKGMRIPFKQIDKIGFEEGIMSSAIFVRSLDINEFFNLCKVPMEDGEKYSSVIKLLVSELTKASDVINETANRYSEKIDDYTEECNSITVMTIDQLSVLLNKLKEFPDLFTTEINAINIKVDADEFEKYLNGICSDVEQMEKSAIKKILSEIKKKNLHSEVIYTYEDQLRKRLNSIEVEELRSLCRDISTMDKATLLRLLKQIGMDYSCAESNDYIISIKTRISELDKAEIGSLCEDINTLSREESILLKEKLNIFDESLTREYVDRINRNIAKYEKAKLDELCNGYDTMDRIQVKELRTQIVNLGFMKESLTGYLIKLHKKIVDFDYQTMNNLCMDITRLSFDEGLNLTLKIQEIDLTEEVKAGFLERLDSHLMGLKKGEVGKYIKWITDLGVLSDNLGIPEWNSPTINNKYLKAKGKYAREIGKYEIPILIHDATSFSGGEEGFVITNEFLYIQSKMYQEIKLGLDYIVRFEMEKKLLGASINMVLKNGTRVIIPNKINKDILPNLLAIINQLVYDKASNPITANKSTLLQTNNESASNQSNVESKAVTEYNTQTEYNTRSQTDNSLAQPKCGKCGCIYTTGQKFCGECGNNLELQSVKTNILPMTTANVNVAISSNRQEGKIDSANILQYCYNELNKSKINRAIGFVSIPGYMPKFEKKYYNAIKSYANMVQESPILLFDTTIFESGKEGLLITNRNIHVKYIFGQPFKYPLSSVKGFILMMDGTALKVGIELHDGTKQFVISSNTNKEEVNDRCNYLNLVLNGIKAMV